MMFKKSNRKKNRRGAAALEFALTAPALILVVFVCFEFARMSMMRNLAQNAAYETARHVMVEGSDQEDAIAKANQILGRLGTKGATIDINGGEEMDYQTSGVTVTIEIPMDQNSLVFPMVYQDKKIISTIALKTERYQGFYDGGASGGN